MSSQCPFMDDRIVSLHQKIKSQPVVIPERYVLVVAYVSLITLPDHCCLF